jgi:hypothetical protein
MKVGNNSIVRWVSKLVARQARRGRPASRSDAQELSAEQLRRVSGGDGAPSSQSSPFKGW